MKQISIHKTAIRKNTRKGIALLSTTLILLVLLFQTVVVPTIAEQASSVLSTSSATNLTDSTSKTISSYRQYLDGQDANPVDKNASNIVVSPADCIKEESSGIEIKNGYEGEAGPSVLTTDASSVAFPVQVSHSAYYQVSVEYFPTPGDGGTILRTVMMDGIVPFQEADNIEFYRIWADQSKVGELRDDLGNDIRPKQVEKPEWTETFLNDPAGFSSTPLTFYLSAGTHKITFSSRMEPMAIRKITLIPRQEIPNYEQVQQSLQGKTGNRQPETITVQGEAASKKSDQTLYPTQDRSSPDVVPYDVRLQRFNTIGGERWKTVGQWIEWTVDIPVDAFYTLGLRWKQDTKMNDVSVRELFVDGKLPFKEAANLLFDYNGGWQTGKLASRQEKKPYEFYLARGTHTIRLRAGLGEYASLVEEAQNQLYELNRIYRQIVTITGPQPDQYRDYQFNITIPQTLSAMTQIRQNLTAMENTIKTMTGGGGQSTAAITKLSFQLQGMETDPETIAYRLNDFQNNISGFGSWINQIKEQPLEIDYLLLTAADSVIPRAEAPFYRVIWHYLQQFFTSFTTDYAAIGSTGKQSPEDITVWIGSGVGTTAGRDQSQLIRQLINENFTPGFKISVQLQLVSMGSLLPATLAGIGPDVALQQSQSDPLNFALRNAVVDLATFTDIESIKSRFYKSALEPFMLDGHLYALPETQSYPMMFYRKDILDEMGISVDLLDDWDSLLLTVLPKIQKSYLQFGLPANMNSYAMLLYQQGGRFYQNGNIKSGMDSMQGIAAFEKFTSIYTEYRQLLAYDFANRFRTGEMPIAINDFTAYNQLSVFAPEIKGLWGMRPVPGVKQADGTINRTVASTVSGGILLSSSKKKSAAWTFLEWWTQEDTQTMYGKELESIMGAAARYPTANIRAMEKMQWEKETKVNLKLQQLQTLAIPEVPGGYFTPRHFDFAFRNVVLSGKDVRETIIKAARNINDEISNKRKEFNLPITSVTP